MMNQSEIELRIPHRPPMLLVDRVTTWDHESLVGERTFRGDEFFFTGTIPARRLYPV